MKSQIANTLNGPIEYTLQGSGPVILVCHGTSANCFSGETYTPLLQAGFSILTPSRPGYGRTPLNVGKSAVESAKALVGLLDFLEIKTCDVMAISGGGPTGIAIAANYPDRVRRLALVAAISRTENRSSEPSYNAQVSFYGPLHNLTWGMLRLISNISPKAMARQTMMTFSKHDSVDALHRLSKNDIQDIARFYQGQSSRTGGSNDLTHTVDNGLLRRIQAPTIVIHSREDNSVPFSQAEWSLANIPHAELCESGFTGHFFWIGSDFVKVSEQLISFLKADD